MGGMGHVIYALEVMYSITFTDNLNINRKLF